MNLALLAAARRSIARHEFPHRLRNSDALLSRRQFVGSAAGTVAAAAGLGSVLTACGRADDGLLTSPVSPRLSLAKAAGQAAPVPIPGGTPALGGAFHVWAPAAVDSVDAEPATITDFNGFVGLAYISGMVTRRNRSTGETVQLPFLDRYALYDGSLSRRRRTRTAWHVRLHMN